MPASSWASPPQASARPKTIGSPPAPMSLALKTLRQNVVSAKAASPSGPGSAMGVGTNPTRWASVAEVGSPVRTKRCWAVEASICTSLIAFAQEAFPARRQVDAHNVRARAEGLAPLALALLRRGVGDAVGRLLPGLVSGRIGHGHRRRPARPVGALARLTQLLL